MTKLIDKNKIKNKKQDKPPVNILYEKDNQKILLKNAVLFAKYYKCEECDFNVKIRASDNATSKHSKLQSVKRHINRTQHTIKANIEVEAAERVELTPSMVSGDVREVPKTQG
jgi:hypothetical protein